MCISRAKMSSSADSIDYLLTHHIGGHGRWQWRLLLYIFPIAFASGYPLMLHTLAAYEPRHRCRVKSCEDEDDLSGGFYPSWSEFALPKDYATKSMFTEAQPYDPCSKYEEIVQGGPCDATNFDRNITEESISRLKTYEERKGDN